MTDRDAETEPMSDEQAAENLRDDPALGAGLADPHTDNPGTDDDATTPDGAVSEQE